MSLLGIPGTPAGRAQGRHRVHETLEGSPRTCGNLSYVLLGRFIFIHRQILL